MLNTYETESRLISTYNTELSVKDFRAAMEVLSVLGLDPAIANTVHQAINSGVVGSFLPSGLQSAILDGIFKVGRSQLSESLLNEKNPIGSSRLSTLRRYSMKERASNSGSLRKILVSDTSKDQLFLTMLLCRVLQKHPLDEVGAMSPLQIRGQGSLTRI